jgi:hypothetical protein
MADADVEQLLAGCEPEVRALALEARALVRGIAPSAAEEPDAQAKLIGYSFIPGTYKGLFVAIAPQRSHVNLMFAKGAELLAAGCDERGLLEGTGKRARHIKLRNRERLDDPAVGRLVEAAVARTPRA